MLQLVSRSGPWPSQYKDGLCRYGVSIFKRIPVLVRRHLHIETTPQIAPISGWRLCILLYFSTPTSKVPNLRFLLHYDAIKWKHFPRCWPFVRGIHRSPVDSPQKGQWQGTLAFFISPWTNSCAKNRDAGDFKRQSARYDVTVVIRYLRLAYKVDAWSKAKHAWLIYTFIFIIFETLCSRLLERPWN